MSKVLLTGGNGFIGAHILDTLLEHGYTVIATVRSRAKGDQILQAHKNIPNERLSYVVVNNLASDGAFNTAVQCDPPINYVIHTASPFPESFQDPFKDVLEPAVCGTKNILQAINTHAPEVKRVVITSSFAAIVNIESPPKVYDETSWNPISWGEAITQRSLAYRGSKKFAEKAAWDFIEEEKPNFDLATMNPPLVYGPMVHHLKNLDQVNTSNQRISDFIQGKCKEDQLPPTGTFLFTDVRDLALAHVRALEIPEAGGKRFFITSGHYSNRRIVECIRETHPKLANILPRSPIDDFPEDVYGFDNSRARETLRVTFRSLHECISDTVDSLLRIKRAESV